MSSEDRFILCEAMKASGLFTDDEISLFETSEDFREFNSAQIGFLYEYFSKEVK